MKKETVRDIIYSHYVTNLTRTDEIKEADKLIILLNNAYADKLDELCVGTPECKADRAYVEAIGDAQKLLRGGGK